jgi:hypothetical protein
MPFLTFAVLNRHFYILPAFGRAGILPSAFLFLLVSSVTELVEVTFARIVAL